MPLRIVPSLGMKYKKENGLVEIRGSVTFNQLCHSFEDAITINGRAGLGPFESGLRLRFGFTIRDLSCLKEFVSARLHAERRPSLWLLPHSELAAWRRIQLKLAMIGGAR